MAPNLTGHMARWRTLIGTWTCRSSATPNAMPSSISIAAAPNNTLQIWVRGPAAQASGFFGFDPISTSWWSSSTNSNGERTFETSSDGKTFSGTVTALHHTSEIRSTTTQIGPTKFRTVSEVRSGGAWAKTTGETVCTKS